MGAVHLGHLRGAAGFERPVAIKRILPEVMELDGWREAVLREAAHASRVRHVNVVSVDDVEEAEGELLLVMQYIEGRSLYQLIASELVPMGIVLRVALDTATGLAAIHEVRDDDGAIANLVHRDVSPQNVLVGLDGISRVADFGIAKSARDAQRTQKGMMRGKMGYLSPEYIAEGIVAASSDMFAFGVVIWEALAGRRLFRAETDIGSIHCTLGAVVPPIEGVPEEIQQLLRSVLQRSPEDRPRSMRAVSDELERLARPFLATPSEVGEYVAKHLCAPPSSGADDVTILTSGDVKLDSSMTGLSDSHERVRQQQQQSGNTVVMQLSAAPRQHAVFKLPPPVQDAANDTTPAPAAKLVITKASKRRRAIETKQIALVASIGLVIGFVTAWLVSLGIS